MRAHVRAPSDPPTHTHTRSNLISISVFSLIIGIDIACNGRGMHYMRTRAAVQRKNAYRFVVSCSIGGIGQRVCVCGLALAP